MSKFKRFKNYEVDAKKVIEYPIYEIEGEPILLLSPATDVNKPYMNNLLRIGKTSIMQARSGSMSSKTLQQNREQDRYLYPRYVIKGWKKVFEDNGSECEFTPENCEDFLNALPDWVLDKIRNFAGNPANFVDEIIDVETAGQD